MMKAKINFPLGRLILSDPFLQVGEFLWL